MDDLRDPLTLFVVAVGAAMIGVQARWRRLLALAKPLATFSLAGVAWKGGAVDLTAGLVLAGIALSVIGDVALLFESERAFMVGLGFFLGAHLAYVAAFMLGGVGPLWTPVVGLVVFGVASAWLVRQLWGGAGDDLRPALLLYAMTITVMVATALATIVGDWPRNAGRAAACGALCFYFSDANLAWNRFVASYRHNQSVTLLLYWAGQLGIALSARWAS